MMVNSKNRQATMKRSLKTWALIAAVALGLGACQNDIEEQVVVKNTRTVKFVTDSAENRTSVDTTGEKPAWAWNDEESFAVLECIDGEYYSEAEEVNFNKTADNIGEIEASFAYDRTMGLEGAHYDYMIVHPKSGFVSHANDFTKGTLTLPAVQEMDGNSYDADADLMVSRVINWDTYCDYDVLPVQFTRLAAVVQLTIDGMELGDKLESVTFTVTGKEDKVIALAGEVTTDLTLPKELAPVKDKVSSSVTVSGNYDGNKVLFTTLPATLEAGDKYTVTAISEKKVYIKEGTIAEGKSLSLKAGYVNRLTVKGVTPSDRWELVKDASTLKEGDVVAIAAKGYDYALSTKLHSNASETSTSAKRDRAAASKMSDGNYLIGGEDVQQLILVTGTAEGTFSFYDEVRGKFLVSTTTGSTYLINREYCGDDTSFAITIDENAVATIKNTEGTYKGNMLRYNTNGYFVSNQNSSTVYKDVCIYRLGGVVGEIPVVDANVTVPDEDEPVTIAEEGATEATAIEEVVFNYVGNWTITPSTTAEWLTVSYDKAKGQLTYTAEANSGAKREATVTITATLKDKEDLTWSFNMVQKGAPQEISIAEFMTKGKDENITYKLTGRITEIPNSATGTFKLTDGTNTAQITYLKLYNGNDAKGNVDFKVGDVMTVTTVVTSTTKGKGGSNKYPSIYKGHYGLTVDTDTSLIGYEGGTATITVAVEKNGNPTMPAESVVIKGEMVANDFVTFSYTDNAETATATFKKNIGGSRNAEFNFTYDLISVSIAVGQQNDPSVKVGWFLVTDINELNVGDKVIIAGKSPDETLNYAISNKVSTGTFRPAQAITLQGNQIANIDGLQQYTLGAGHADCPNTWSFKGDSDSKYLYYSSGLKVTSTLNAAGSWTISISDDKATLTSQTTNSNNTMMLNWTTSNQTFSMYKSTQTGKGAIYIYKYYN